MAGQKASTATVLPLTDTALLIGEDGGTSGVFTGAGLARAIGMRQNCNTATQAISAATLTKINGSELTVPSGNLIQVKTKFQWQIWLTKGAGGTLGRSFFIRLGTLGTTADALIATFNSGAGTGVVDQAYIEIVAICFSIAANVATFESSFTLSHALATTGFSTTTNQIITPASTPATRDISPAGLIASLSVTTGTSETLTIRQVLAQAFQL
jgi:hypothetical protein